MNKFIFFKHLFVANTNILHSNKNVNQKIKLYLIKVIGKSKAASCRSFMSNFSL